MIYVDAVERETEVKRKISKKGDSNTPLSPSCSSIGDDFRMTKLHMCLITDLYVGISCHSAFRQQ